MGCTSFRSSRRLCRLGVAVLVLGFAVSPALAEIRPTKGVEREAVQVAPVPSNGVTAIAEPIGDTKELISVLVYTDTNETTAALTKANVRNFAALSGAYVKYEYTVLPGVMNLRDVHPDDVAELAKIPGVIKIESDLYHENVVKLHDSIPLIRGLQSQITGAGYSADGTGVRVCIVDTGIDMDHTMFSARIDTGASYDFANNDSNPDDDHGHGSHCSGIALGRTGLTYDPCGTGAMPFQGLAPNATLIGAKVLNSAGGGTDSNIIAGIDHCADQSGSGGRADVISMSIGTGNYSGICTHSWAVAANNAAAGGVVAIAASGNENNSNSMGSPACGADVIAVGMTWKNDYPTCEDATTNWNWGICTDSGPQTDDVGCFSNESDYLDVTAPGANIWSAGITAGGTSITGSSGTSMSCPTVAGLAALILQVEPTATPAQVRQYIRDGAIDMGPAGFDRAYGYGRIDVLNTLSLLTPCTGDGDCDDGNWCNGSETCNVGSGSCVAGSDPCPGESCDEVNDVCVPLPTVQYSWNMNSNPGWTMNGDWAYGQPTGGGGEHGNPDPTSGATGSNVIGYNLAGDYGASIAETHMTTTAINCTGFIDTTLRFQRWLGVESPTYDHAYIRVSTNGSTWTQVWTNGAEVTDAAWGQVEYDISAVADGQSTVYIRWTMGTTDSSWFYCGWNIDDVEILATTTGGATCSDGILNQGEDRIDCGGPCTACNCLSDGACSNGAYCDGTETCDTFGNCQGGTAVDCNDGVACTNDSCNEGTDSCDNVTNDAACDDGAYCNGSETCHATLGCQSGTAVNCNDGVGCTDDSCNEGTDSCDNTANDANCDNGAWCDGSETCHATLDCQSGTAPDCDDGVACTNDSCNEGTDSCDNVTNDAACDDGTFCNGAETCHATLGCQAGGDPCPGQFCDEGGDTCVDCLVDGDCDDGAYCNGAETCVGGACQAGTAVNCDDGVGCTDDSCNEGTDSCDNVANDANCDNGAWCDGAETCNAVSDCQAGNSVNCDDGVGCTDDSCNEGTDSCDNVANDANCDNGAYCDGAETCNAVSDCQAGTAVNCDDGVGCTADSCNEATDTCDNVTNDAACDDGLFCNGAETCHATLDCQSGSDPCPGQTCDEPTDTCVDCQVDGDCDDGQWCNGAETCNAGTCQAGTAINCDDGVACTDDSCNDATDSCDNIANDANCDNGAWCDGAETCHATLGCQAGTAVNCDDAVGCTDDSCNEATDSCDNVTNDANCDNGAFCDGAETCNAVSDCQSGSDPCPGQLCDETGDVCVDCFVDGDCDDAAFCNGAETCAGGACQAGSDPCPGQTCNETTDTCETGECVVDGDCDDASACTVDTCNAGVCSNDCAGSVSGFPYAEDFDASQGAWANLGGDDFDWTRNSGSTPSSNTGPSGDHTTGSGSYMYIECSSPRVQGETAMLEGPCVDLTMSSTADLTFWYHMYGATVGTLDVEVSDDCTTWANVWTLSGDQGNTWFEATVNLDAYAGSVVKVRFIGTRGSSWDSDIAIDDIGVDASGNPCSIDADCDDFDLCTTDACVTSICQNVPIDCDDGNGCTTDTCSGGVCSSDCPGGITAFPDTEDFEAGQGAWANVAGDDFDWTRNSGSTPSSGTGPTGDHTTGSGWYMYVETSSPNYPTLTATLEGPCIDLTGSSSASMSFWYHIFGTDVGTLYLESSTDCATWATEWSLSGSQGDAWQEAVVDLSAHAGTVVTLRFRGVSGPSWSGDLCVDDILFDATGGPECTTDPECDDGVYCNGAETCVAQSCVAGTAIDCNDGVGCTDDACNEGTDSCDNVANDANCDNGAWCDGDETCDSVSDCLAGAAVNCDDGVGCTDDSCNEGTDSCDNTANDANCDNGVYCDGAETCDGVSDCLTGTAIDCDDAVGCTVDSCNEATDSCDNTPDDGACDDGLFCNGAETCNAVSDCQAGSDPCPGQNCDEVGDVCVDCQVDGDCDDGVFCNGAETCSAGTCQAGTAVDCDDGVGCTDDSCNEGTDSCDNVANDGNCDNGAYCDGAETCNAVSDCQAGTAVDCDDGVGCTDDSCNEATDSCDNVANDANCDDGAFCNGAETCHAVSDCQAGSDPCPGQTCNEVTDTCEGGSAARLESGTVSVDGVGLTVNLVNTYTSPVVVCSVHYNNNTTPVVTRVTSVTGTSFDVYLQNPSGGAVSADNVSYLVVEEGTWTIDGVNIEAQTYLSTVTDENNSWVGEAQSYGQAYTNPVVLGQVMSDNDPAWSVFWCYGTARANPPSTSALVTGKEVAEDSNTVRAAETVGFIVIEAGSGTIGGVAYEAALGADTVRGVTNSPPYAYTFGTSFASAPSVAVTTLAAMDGGNGGWSYTYGPTMATTTTLNLAIDEDQINDAERAHTPEQVGYAVFETAAVYP